MGIRRKGHVAGCATSEDVTDMYWLQNMAQSEIAKRLGVTQSAVFGFMKRHNIPRRTGSDAAIGRKHPNHSAWMKTHRCGFLADDVRQRTRQLLLGRPKSKETKQRISCSKKGKGMGANNPFYGKSHSEDAKHQMSLSLMKRFAEDPTYRLRVSAARKRDWANPEYRAKVIPAILMGRYKRPTSLEEQFTSICSRNNLPFVYVGDGSFLVGNLNPDFIHTGKLKLCVEVANRYHHTSSYEKNRIAYFGACGWQTLVFWEEELLDEEAMLAKIGGVL